MFLLQSVVIILAIFYINKVDTDDREASLVVLPPLILGYEDLYFDDQKEGNEAPANEEEQYNDEPKLKGDEPESVENPQKAVKVIKGQVTKIRNKQKPSSKKYYYCSEEHQRASSTSEGKRASTNKRPDKKNIKESQALNAGNENVKLKGNLIIPKSALGCPCKR